MPPRASEQLDENQARPFIEKFLENRACTELAKAEIKRLRDAAKIEYVGEFTCRPSRLRWRPTPQRARARRAARSRPAAAPAVEAPAAAAHSDAPAAPITPAAAAAEKPARPRSRKGWPASSKRRPTGIQQAGASAPPKNTTKVNASMIKRFFQQLSTRLGAIAALVLLGLAGPCSSARRRIRAGRRRHRTHYRVPEPGSHHRDPRLENGTVTFPLIGNVELGGQTIAKAEQTVASKLREGGFVLKPQSTSCPCRSAATRSRCSARSTAPAATRSKTFNTRLSDMLATAGGIAASGADTVVLIGVRDGKSVRREIDLPTRLPQAATPTTKYSPAAT